MNRKDFLKRAAVLLPAVVLPPAVAPLPEPPSPVCKQCGSRKGVFLLKGVMFGEETHEEIVVPLCRDCGASI